MHEFDYQRDPAQDLTSQKLWDSILKDCVSGSFDVVVLSPPCNTFSRARWNFCGAFGPRPLRSSHFPKGFPWLREQDRVKVCQGNFFMLQSLLIAETVSSHGGFFILEHPEQLGRVSSGDIPGSAWDWPEVRNLVEVTGAACWPVHQCFFGASTSKPTRFASNLPAALAFGVHWHRILEDGAYDGPLGRCPHAHNEKLLGYNNGWRSTSSAAYPDELCQYLAFLIFSAVNATDATVASHASVTQDLPHPAEAFAETIQGPPSAAEVMILFDLLPKTRPHARPAWPQEQHSSPVQCNRQVASSHATPHDNSHRLCARYVPSFIRLMPLTTSVHSSFFVTCIALCIAIITIPTRQTWWCRSLPSKAVVCGLSTRAARIFVGTKVSWWQAALILSRMALCTCVPGPFCTRRCLGKVIGPSLLHICLRTLIL